jgi:hypothetical protein
MRARKEKDGAVYGSSPVHDPVRSLADLFDGFASGNSVAE